MRTIVNETEKKERDAEAKKTSLLPCIEVQVGKEDLLGIIGGRTGHLSTFIVLAL